MRGRGGQRPGSRITHVAQGSALRFANGVAVFPARIVAVVVAHGALIFGLLASIPARVASIILRVQTSVLLATTSS